MDVVGELRPLEAETRRATPLDRVLLLLEREWLLVAVAAFACASAALAAVGWILSDSWYVIVYGREIVHHGLPHADTMTILGRGHAWLDQQWLGQVALYGVYAAGGTKLLALASALLFAGVFAAAVGLARRRGASALSLIVVVILAWSYMTTWVQAEVLARPLFLALLALLVAQSRRPSRWVLLAFPLLVLWANVHGAVVLGAALVALLGLVELVQRARAGGLRTRGGLRAVALVTLPWLCVAATPYGLSTFSYYRATILNSAFHRYVYPWQAPTPFSGFGAPFFLLAALTVAVAARRHNRLTPYELAALGVTLLAATEARRSVAWFATAAIVLVAPVLEREDETRWRVRSRLPLLAAVLALVLGAATVGAAATRSRSAYEQIYDQPAAQFVAGYVRTHPNALVFANDPYPDWLVYHKPSLWGKIAYDARWEQLTPKQIRTLYAFQHEIGPHWDAPIRGYALVMIGKGWPSMVRAFREKAGYRIVFESPQTVVFEQHAALHGRSR